MNALNEFLNNPTLALKPVGFIDDDLRNQGKQVNGVPVLGTLDSLENILEKNSISEVILSIGNIAQEKLERLSQICHSSQISLRRFQTRLEDIPTEFKKLNVVLILILQNDLTPLMFLTFSRKRESKNWPT